LKRGQKGASFVQCVFMLKKMKKIIFELKHDFTNIFFPNILALFTFLKEQLYQEKSLGVLFQRGVSF